MESLPLVSVICLCHNQRSFVGAAIRSVLTQTYENIELIVVDDASSDGSKEEITSVLAGKEISFLSLDENQGNCAAFNMGLALAKGDYVIDLAGDDLLLPTRVELGINDFLNAAGDVGVHFSDAFLITENGDITGTHHARNSDGKLVKDIPSGDIYVDVIKSYFVCPPTMMMKKRVLDELGGYDESLLYEDFDFWVRSSRNYQYLFNPAPLVKKRILKESLSSSQFAFRTKHAYSTYKVCEKILRHNRSIEEDRALVKRCKYEIKQCVKTFNFSLIRKYRKLIKQAKKMKRD